MTEKYQITALLFVVLFIASRRQNIAALALFVTGQGPGLARATAHNDKYIHPLSAFGAFDLAKSGRVLSLVASV